MRLPNIIFFFTMVFLVQTFILVHKNPLKQAVVIKEVLDLIFAMKYIHAFQIIIYEYFN